MPTTFDTPVRVKDVNKMIGDWISRLGHIHVEGQVTEVSNRTGSRTAFLTLRDPQATASISVTSAPNLLPPGLSTGDRVITYGKPSFWQGRGNLSLRAHGFQAVGEGDLLQRIAKLRATLKAEGADRRKKPLPQVPRTIGLITGDKSAAERDVLQVAINRWPMAEFEIINTKVQGPGTVKEVTAAIKKLDANTEVDVIIIARGGGSVEDLLPFSDEALVRAAMACGTPIISAIGHEPDNPILDDVADFRAATPTDAAKNVVPDHVAEVAGVLNLYDQLHASFGRNLATERAALQAMGVRVDNLTGSIIQRERVTVRSYGESLVRALQGNFNHEMTWLANTGRHLDAISPMRTLERGYSLVTDAATGRTITGAGQASGGSKLTITLSDGSTLDVMVMALAHAALGIRPKEGNDTE